MILADVPLAERRPQMAAGKKEKKRGETWDEGRHFLLLQRDAMIHHRADPGGSLGRRIYGFEVAD